MSTTTIEANFPTPMVGFFALGGQWGSSGLRKDALLWRRDEGGLGSPHARVYGKWPTADARRVAPG